jgi:hypothetical protein
MVVAGPGALRALEKPGEFDLQGVVNAEPAR